ncbi:MAG: hypothetical protein KIS30_06505 [Thermoplasmata archaeon]|nr:hypothetical protein [Candidatus Sysuiplasma acidicola]MBX8646388.1 hypothetical protein [Candidatus Sysuiplasma acidicola]
MAMKEAMKEYRKITVRLNEELYKALKYWTVDNDTTVNSAVTMAIEKLVKNRGR